MIRKLLTITLLAGSLGIVACGGGNGIDQDEADKIQDKAEQVREDAQKTAEEVRNGTKDAEQMVDIVASPDLAQNQASQQQANPAGRRHDKRHARAIARTLIVMPIADQHKRKEAGQFPEKDQQDQIAGEDNAEHRSHEGQ